MDFAKRMCYYDCYNEGTCTMSSLKVRKIGNSLGVVLPKELAARLKVNEGDHLFVTEAPDGSMRISSYDPAFAEQMDAAKDAMAQYRNTLRELAK